MRRTAHILLALFAGILLQANLVGVVGAAHEQADAPGKFSSTLIDPGSLASLLDADLPDAPQPYLGGASPKPFALNAVPTAVLPAGHSVSGTSRPDRSPVSSRPVYLTTLRLRL